MVGLWLGATAASVAVVMGGVRLVADSVSDADRLPLVVAGADGGDAVDTEPSPRGSRRTRTRSPAPSPREDDTPPDGPDGPGRPASDDPEPPPTQSSDPPDPPPPPQTPPTTATPDDPTPTPTATESDEPEPAPEDRAYELEGGSVGIRFSATRVEVLWATPRDGFAVRILRESETRVVVTFRSRTHVSELEARWSNGPRADAEEDDDNSGSG